MGELVKVFKPDASVIWVCRGMIAFGGVVALAGVVGHQAMISCLGIFLLTIFLVISFRQSSQTIQVFTDRVVFLYPGQEAWAISFNSFRKLELTTTYKNVSKYAPGRSILLRFVEFDDKVCAEANVNVFDKNAIKTMIELIRAYKPDLILNSQADHFLRIGSSKSTTIDAVTKTE